MEKELKNELRKLLTGRTVRDEEGVLMAVPEGSRLIYQGVSDTTGHRKILERSAVMEVARDTDAAFYQVLEALQRVGILVNMRSQPKALCALKRYFLTKAVILCVLPEQDGQIRIRAYTGRSLLAPACCSHAIAKLRKNIAAQQQAERK